MNSLKLAGSASDRDGFVTVFAPNGSVVLSSLIGGSGDDEVYGVGADNYGSVYLTGHTRSADFGIK